MPGRRFAAISAVLIAALMVLTAGVAVAEGGDGARGRLPSWSQPPPGDPGGVRNSDLAGRHRVITDPVTTPGVAGAAVAEALSQVPAAVPADALASVLEVTPVAMPALAGLVAPAAAPVVVTSASVAAPTEAATPPAGPVAAPEAGPVAAPDPPALPGLAEIGGFDSSAPAAARALLTTPTGRSVSVVLALMLAILVFLGVHRRLDRRDLKLATARTAGELARFR